jgi:glutamyl-Q tRNA(Asp) synthetase
LVAALASWLDAKAHQGQWLLRIENVDTPRCVPGAAEQILHQLQACGLVPDGTVVWQSSRSSAYAQALAQLQQQGLAYACTCSRKSIAAYWAAHNKPLQAGAELPYPGTCRPSATRSIDKASAPESPHTWRFNIAQLQSQHRLPLHTPWHDRRLGAQAQNVQEHIGDFVLQRADQVWAYQLAVVVDDAWQGMTHVVRGLDLADNTPRQRLLQIALGLPALTYLHTPLVLDAEGHKLSKQTGAAAVDVSTSALAQQAVSQAAVSLGLPPQNGPLSDALQTWVQAWAALYDPTVST